MKKNLSIKEIRDGLEKKEFSAEELLRFYFKNINKRDKEIHAFLSLDEEGALSQARKADGLISQKKELPLLGGIPAALKDVILAEGQKCTAGSKILENYIAPYDATVTKKLKEAGAVIIGKTNMDEFAMGSSTENSAYGPTRNPHDTERVPGGSSGGSAAAVAADFCPFSMGSDTGGSIRQPASFCGVVGLKPTYGAVSRYGLMAMASSLDQIGPFTRTVADCKTVFDVIKGKDTMDSTSVEIPEKSCNPDIKSMRLGIPKEYFVKGMDKKVEEQVKTAIKRLEACGIKTEEISLPHTEYALATYYIIMPAEVSANLARYDGIKYGHSAQGKAENLLSVYLQSREEGFGEESRRRIMLGTYTLSAGYYDAYYLRAQKVRTLIREDFKKAFEKVDAILAPVSPTLPFKFGEKTQDPLSMYLSDIFTVSVNLAGLPAISVPYGKINNLPSGIQIIGKPFEEENLFILGEILEKSCQ